MNGLLDSDEACDNICAKMLSQNWSPLKRRKLSVSQVQQEPNQSPEASIQIEE